MSVFGHQFVCGITLPLFTASLVCFYVCDFTKCIRSLVVVICYSIYLSIYHRKQICGYLNCQSIQTNPRETFSHSLSLFLSFSLSLSLYIYVCVCVCVVVISWLLSRVTRSLLFISYSTEVSERVLQLFLDFPLTLDLYFIILIVKQGSIKYRF